MPIIIGIIEEERNRLESLIEFYKKMGKKGHLDRLPEAEENLKLCNFLLDSYEDYKKEK